MARFNSEKEHIEIEIKPVEYKFNVQNALGQSREYTIYYYIVPPVNNSK